MTGLVTSGEKRLVLVSGRAHMELAQQVGEELHCGVSPTTAYDFASGETYVRFNESVRGADVFAFTSEKDDDHTLRVDLLDAELAAHSSGIINLEYPDVISSIFFTHEGVKRILGRTTTDGVYMFKVPTDSMVPTITQNDIVFIDTNVKEYIGEGVYSFNLNGETYIKRLQRLPTGVIMALSDNPLYHPFEITEDLFDTAEIIGKFIKAVELKPKDL